MKEYMNEISNIEQFEQAYLQEKVTIFVFSANWCPDCAFIEPFMPKLVEKYSHYDFCYIDRDKWIPICQRMMIMGIPSFVATQNGKEIGRFVSKLRKTEVQIDEFLGGLCKSEVKK